MRQIISALGAAIAIAAGLWCTLAAWLYANGWIRLGTELSGYPLSFAAVIVGAAIYSSRRSRLRYFFSVAVLIVPLLVVLAAWICSDKLFVSWKMKKIGPAGWQQMAYDLSRTAREALARQQSYLSKEELPKSCEPLGMKDELWVPMIMELEDGNVGIQLLYGNMHRRWALRVGPNDFLDKRLWTICGSFPVASNAMFYIGAD